MKDNVNTKSLLKGKKRNRSRIAIVIAKYLANNKIKALFFAASVFLLFQIGFMYLLKINTSTIVNSEDMILLAIVLYSIALSVLCCMINNMAQIYKKYEQYLEFKND